MYSDDESHRKTTKFGMKARFLTPKNDEENNGATKKLSSRLTEKLSSKLYGENCRLHY
jgi:hypothetical protein